MPEKRKRLHLKSRNRSTKQNYGVPSRRITLAEKAPRRGNPSEHAMQVKSSIISTLSTVEEKMKDRTLGLESSRNGSLLSFNMLKDSGVNAQSLEDIGLRVELATIAKLDEEFICATVYVPDESLLRYTDILLGKVDSFATSGGSANRKLVENIEEARVGNALSLYNGPIDALPIDGTRIWWEVWTSRDGADNYRKIAGRLEISTADDLIEFPDRSVLLSYATVEELNILSFETSSILEIRLSQDNPEGFLNSSPSEIKEWIDELGDRLTPAEYAGFSILVLDGGTNRSHLLLERFIAVRDWQTYDSGWGPEENSRNTDTLGHGTKMAGLALYGDVLSAFSSTSSKNIEYCIETYKILDPIKGNPQRLYGKITKKAVLDLEIENPTRKRVMCMAVTSPKGTYYGQPSSWSASLDLIAFGEPEDDLKRLFIVSAGNVRGQIDPSLHADYTELNRDVNSQIENPAQAWNALTVGAYTQKFDPLALFKGKKNYANPGDLSPRSRTSFGWSDQWPMKPDIVMEGGNYLSDTSYTYREETVSLLTTHHTPGSAAMDIITDTSAATALAANMAIDLYASYPEYWPETIRGLMVHSAAWTPQMRARLKTKNNRDKVDLLRQYGYGVPNAESAKFSLNNNVTMVIEERLKPFKVSGSDMQYGELAFHKLPWIEANIDQFESAKLTMRVTLSYFVEPNPSTRGYVGRYRYASHGLRFDLKRRNETEEEFKRRKNALARNESYEGTDAKASRWMLGPQIRQMSGSIFSDWWSGPAIELAQCDSLVVFPVGGWWKSRVREPYSSRDARYSLIVSIQTDDRLLEIDLLTPIESVVELPIPISYGAE